jgi:hypothetical protein
MALAADIRSTSAVFITLRTTPTFTRPKAWVARKHRPYFLIGTLMDRNDSFTVSISCHAACAGRVHEGTAMYFAGVRRNAVCARCDVLALGHPTPSHSFRAVSTTLRKFSLDDLLGPVVDYGVLTLMRIVVVSFGYGDHRRLIQADYRLPAGAARQCQSDESPDSQRHSLCGRTRLQVARAAQAVRELAHNLYPHESLVEEWRTRSGVRPAAERADRAHQDRSSRLGQHHR